MIGPAFRFPGFVHKVYHRSFAIMSAVIVPNASDLAEGISFTGDRMLSIPVPPFKVCKDKPPEPCKTNSAICAKAAVKCDSIDPKRNDPATEGRMFDPAGYYHTRTVPLETIRELPPQVREFHKRMLQCLVSLEDCSNKRLENFPEDGQPADKNTEEP